MLPGMGKISDWSSKRYMICYMRVMKVQMQAGIELTVATILYWDRYLIIEL